MLAGSDSQRFFISNERRNMIRYEEGGWGREEDITFLEPTFPYIQFLYKQVLLYVAKQTH